LNPSSLVDTHPDPSSNVKNITTPLSAFYRAAETDPDLINTQSNSTSTTTTTSTTSISPIAATTSTTTTTTVLNSTVPEFRPPTLDSTTKVTNSVSHRTAEISAPLVATQSSDPTNVSPKDNIKSILKACTDELALRESSDITKLSADDLEKLTKNNTNLNKGCTVPNNTVVRVTNSSYSNDKHVTFDTNLPSKKNTSKNGYAKSSKTSWPNSNSNSNANINPINVRFMSSNYLSCINITKPTGGLALIDTGAENANLISKKYLESLQKEGYKFNYLPDSTKISTLNKEMKNYGQVSLSLTVENIQLPEISFLVVESLGAYNVILGLPAIEQLHIVPNISAGTTQILNQTVCLNKNKQYRKTIPVRTTATIRLKPGMEYTIPVQPDSL
jgi:hypothetical protein